MTTKRTDLLTQDERDLLVKIAEGASRFDIACWLDMPSSAVDRLQAALRRKLGVATDIEAAVIAVREGVV
jgi:DNA-binding NarL/FixJ family response regulator